MDKYSQDIDRLAEVPHVVITKNGLPMSDDDVQEDLERMQTKIKQLEALMSEAILIRGPNDEEFIKRWQKALELK